MEGYFEEETNMPHKFYGILLSERPANFRKSLDATSRPYSTLLEEFTEWAVYYTTASLVQLASSKILYWG